MKSATVTAGELLSARNQIIKLPVFQRNYSWQIENCDRLLTDLVNAASRSNDPYFLGTINLKKESNHVKILVDGQQRVTTLILIIKAAIDLTDDEKIKKDFDSSFLHNTGHDFGEHSFLYRKFVMTKNDDVILEKLLNGDELTEKEKLSNIIKNFNFLKNQMSELFKSGKLTYTDINEALENMQLFQIDPDQSNIYEIYETINSTGVGLKAIDLFKNRLFLSFDDSAVQDEYYLKYWSKMEQNVALGSLDDFLFDYMVYKRQYQMNVNGKSRRITKRNLFECVKAYHENVIPNASDDERSAFIFEDMYKASLLYKKLLFSDTTHYDELTEDQKLVYATVYQCECTTARPVLMELYAAHEAGKLTYEELLEALHGVVTMTLRSKVVAYKGIVTEFANAFLRRVDEKDPLPGSYIEKFWQALVSGNGKSAFPSDDYFRKNFMEIELYKALHAKGAKYILYTLEEHNGSVNELPDCEKSTLSVEHIMPQTLSHQWKRELSKTDKNNYSASVHTIGNLALTGDNQKLSNSTFDIKKEIYRSSVFLYTRELAKKSKWDIAAITARSEELADEAVKIWNIPEAYKDIKNAHALSYSFDEDPSLFKSSKPETLIIGESVEIHTNSWKDLILAMCDYLLAEDSETFSEVEQVFKYSFFEAEEDEHGPNSAKLSDGTYVKGGVSAERAMLLGNELLNCFDKIAGTTYSKTTEFTLKQYDDKASPKPTKSSSNDEEEENQPLFEPLRLAL